MEFDWNEDKRQSYRDKHKVDFLHAALIFEGPVYTVEDGRRDYGEVRSVSIGMVDGTCFVVVHTDRDGVTRLISAWKGSRRDRAEYEARLAGRPPPDEG